VGAAGQHTVYVMPFISRLRLRPLMLTGALRTDADNAMSRPPSPSNKYIDLSPEHAEATRQIQNDEQSDDEQMRRAMAESIKDMPGQENGTIKTGQQFGPAQRPYYPEAQWALAPIASSREFVQHPPPPKRRRIEGSPAFLRGPPESSYNAPLLTIYHSIPLAREALLCPPLQVYSYGYNPEWWAGTTDENTKSLSVQQPELGAEDRRKYLAELQCLMAFLDNTNRAYGSVDALADLRYYQYYNAQSEYTKFLETWQQAAMDEKSDEPLTQVFTSSATAKGPNIGAVPETQQLFSVEGAITDARSQVEVLDKIVWSDTPNRPLDDIFIDQFGHILTMKVYNNNPGASHLGLTPTEVWYLDRYMHHLRDALSNMRQQCHRLSREQLRLGQARSRLGEMPGLKSGPRVDVRKALADAKSAIALATDDSARISSNLVDISTTVETGQLYGQINTLLTNIDKKLKELNYRMSGLEAQKQQIMSDLTDPTHSSHPLRHKYVLQGVSTRPNVTYIRKLNHDLIGIDDDDEPHEMWQWWRTAWAEAPDIQSEVPVAHVEDSQDAADSSVPFSVRKVSSKDVLGAVENEYHTAILVYASETAMQFRPSALPTSLRQFVEQDNRAFEGEASSQYDRRSGRGRSWSNETNSTMRDDSNPFDDSVYPGQPRDVTPMSTSTIRSLDGQPSPKRPRSSDESMHDLNLMDMPPSYEDIVGSGEREMAEKKGNKIGYFAEQMMQQVDEHEQKG